MAIIHEFQDTIDRLIRIGDIHLFKDLVDTLVAPRVAGENRGEQLGRDLGQASRGRGRDNGEACNLHEARLETVYRALAKKFSGKCQNR